LIFNWLRQKIGLTHYAVKGSKSHIQSNIQPNIQSGNQKRSQAGNIFFTLFGAVALVGVVGVSTSTLMRGPVGTVIKLNQNAKAEAQMQIAQRLAMLEAANQPLDGDCDSDTFIEPNPFQNCANGLTGGGCIPAAIGSTRQDPWGTDYGYCAWDHGSIIGAVGCNSSLLGGDAAGNGIVIAIVSAGPDRQFQTECQADPGYTVEVVSSDDIVLEMTYDAAVTASGGLWSLIDPSTAGIDRNIDVDGTANFQSDGNFAGNLTLGNAGSQLDLRSGALILLPTEATSGPCNGANQGALRRDTNSGAQEVLQICDSGTGWVDIGGAGAELASGNEGDLQFNDGSDALGSVSTLNYSSATNQLTVTNFEATGDVTVGTDLSIIGATSAGSLSAGTTTLGGTTAASMDVTGALDVDGDTTLDGLTAGTSNLGATTITSTLNVNSGSILAGLSAGATTLDTLTVTNGSNLNTLVLTGAISDSDSNVVINDGVDISGVVRGEAFIDYNGGADPEGMFFDGNNLQLRTAGDTRLEIDQAGDIGINLAGSPTTDVDIGGVIRLRDMSMVSGAACSLGGAISYSGNDELLICSDTTNIWEVIGASGGGGTGTGGLWDDGSGYIHYDNLAFFMDAGQDLNYSSASSLVGAGTRFLWYTSAGAFRVGTVSGDQWDNSNVGDRSIAMGRDTLASGTTSVALGDSASAEGANSFAFGLGSGAATAPTVTGANSFGIFMGAQDGVDLNAPNTMLLAGGRLVIDPNDSATNLVVSNPSLAIDVAGNVGAQQYCDDFGANCFLASDVAGGTITAPGANTEIIFNSGGALGSNPNLVFTSAGRVGIGTSTPTQELDVNGNVRVGNSLFFGMTTGDAPTYAATVTDFIGLSDTPNTFVASRLLGVNAAGDAVEFLPLTTGADNLGDHTATQNVQLGTHWLSGDGGDEGIYVYTDGLVYIERAIESLVALHIDFGGIAMDQNANGDPGYISELGLDGIGLLGSSSRQSNPDLYVDNVTGYVGLGMAVANTRLEVDGTIRMAYGGEACDGNREGAIHYDSSDDTFYACATSGGWVALTTAATGDNLGNHTATQALDLDNNNITNGGTIAGTTITGTAFSGGTFAGTTITGTTMTGTGFNLGAAGVDGSFASGALTGAGTGNFTVDSGNSAANMIFARDGTEAMRLDASDNLGLGTASSQTRLDVNGTIRMAYGGEACDGNREGAIHYDSSNDTFFACATAGGWVALATGGGDNLGSHTATQALDLDNNNIINGGTIAGTTITGTAFSGGTFAGTTVTGTALNLGAAGVNGSFASGALTGAGTGDFTVDSGNSAANMIFARNATEAMRLDASDNLGLGTTTPDTRLDVDGTIRMAYGGEACDANREGAIHYNSANDTFFACATSGSWTEIATVASTNLNDLADVTITNAQPNDILFRSGGEWVDVRLDIDSLADGTRDSTRLLLGSNASGGLRVTSVGADSMTNDAGSDNTAVGFSTLGGATSGNTNTAIGSRAMSATTTAFANTAIGNDAMRIIASGEHNVALGRDVLESFTSGSFNVVLGARSGSLLTSGSSNILIGEGTETPIATTSNHLNIGNSIYGDLANDYIGIGNDSPDVALDVTGDIEYTGTITDVSDRRLKTDIQMLDPANVLERLTQIDTYTFSMIGDENRRIEYGVMAQEVEPLFPELVKTANDEMQTKSVNYVGFIAPLIETTKSLKAENDALRAELSEMKLAQSSMHKDLMKEVNALKAHTGFGIDRAQVGPIMFGAMVVGMFMMGLLLMGANIIIMRRRRELANTKPAPNNEG